MFRLRSPRILRGFARRVYAVAGGVWGGKRPHTNRAIEKEKGFYFFDYFPNIASNIFVLVIITEGINPDITDTHIIITARTK